MLHLPNPYSRHHSPMPQFLIISPPKTGSTWLADNLRHHPQLFLPAVKEVRYFSMLCRWLDLDWYGKHFSQAEGRKAGEASPSYAALPPEAIRWLRDLAPRMKLIFLMREPVSRAWSHAKHMHRYREGSFEGCTAPLSEVPDSQWFEHIAGDWPLAMSDYLGQLRRWLAEFPRDQIFVGFYESIAERPEALLREIFAFLGVDPDVDLRGFPVKERILVGPEGEPRQYLTNLIEDLFRWRTEALADLLQSSFNLALPSTWPRTARWEPTEARPREFADADLLRITAEEATFRTSYRELFVDFCGHDVVFFRRRLLAIPHFLGPRDLGALQQMPIDRLIAERTILTAPDVAKLKDDVLSRVKERAELLADERHSSLEGRFQWAREETIQLHRALVAVTEEVNRLAQTPAWMRTIREVGRRLANRIPSLPRWRTSFFG
jgi:hypothetical protein